jgi:hypothetical protein
VEKLARAPHLLENVPTKFYTSAVDAVAEEDIMLNRKSAQHADTVNQQK